MAHALGRAVPFDAYCASTTDPATRLITHAEADGLGAPEGGPGGGRGNVFLDRLYFEERLDQLAALLRARRPAATLAEITAGAPERSLRHRELLGPLGFAHEVSGVFTDGGLWGSLDLIRRADRPDFGPREVRLLRRVAPHVGAGLKAAALRARAAAGGDGPAAPGVLTLAPDGRVLSATPAAALWLADLEDLHPAWRDGAPPVPVRMVAGALRRALAPAGGGDPGAVPRVRVRGRSGRWLTLYASLTEPAADRPGETVVVIAPAPPDEVAWLNAAAYGLSGREAEVIERIARGFSTRADRGRPCALRAHRAAPRGQRLREGRGAQPARPAQAPVPRPPAARPRRRLTRRRGRLPVGPVNRVGPWGASREADTSARGDLRLARRRAATTRAHAGQTGPADRRGGSGRAPHRAGSASSTSRSGAVLWEGPPSEPRGCRTASPWRSTGVATGPARAAAWSGRDSKAGSKTARMSSTQRRSRTARSGGTAHTERTPGRTPAPGGEGPTRAQRVAALATVRAGGAHADLGQVQRILRRLRFLGADEAVQADRLDRPTSEALRRYQRQRQLPETGDFDAATRAELAQPVCGTPDRRPARQSRGLRFNTPVGAWDRRDFRNTFTTAPGSSGTLTQTLSFADAKAAVNRAFATWSKVDVQLRFTEVALNKNPDVIIEWVPFDHSQQAKDDTNGGWELPDATSLDDKVDPAAAHADFPPRSISGDADGNVEDPPLCLHFDDEEELWDDDLTFRVALHEIGHLLGLDHSTPPPPDPGEAPQRAVMEPQLWSYSDLQDDDRAGVRSLYTVPGPERFNFIWMEGTLERRAEWGVTPDEIESTIEAARDEGFQPARLNAYVLPDGGRRYNVVLEKLTQDRHWVGGHTRPDFEQKRGEYEGQGYRLIDVNTVVSAGGEARYNAVWARNGVNLVAFVGLDLVELEQTVEKFKALRYRPTTINGYQTPGGESGWNLIVVKQGELGDGRFWRATWNATRDALFAAPSRTRRTGTPPPTSTPSSCATGAASAGTGSGRRWTRSPTTSARGPGSGSTPSGAPPCWRSRASPPGCSTPTSARPRRRAAPPPSRPRSTRRPPAGTRCPWGWRWTSAACTPPAPTS